MLKNWKQLECFELKRDINPIIMKGMIGVILELLDGNNFLVEFVKKDGTNYEYNGDGIFELTGADIQELE